VSTEGMKFEDEVRRVARALWAIPEGQGAKFLDGRERDAYFETDDTIHIIESTTSTHQDKAQNDLKKTNDAVIDLRQKTQKSVRGWVITLHEPSAHQRETAKRYSRTTTIIGFNEFFAKLLDVEEYFLLRDRTEFGSIRNPFEDGTSVLREQYIEMDIAELDEKQQSSPSRFVSLAILADQTLKGSGTRTTIVVGDFGIGKSMTLRELYYRLRGQYRSRKHTRFPIFLNLVDHRGQTSPDEALIRHGQRLGFTVERSMKLVRAWRQGFVDLLLDGFDELAGRSNTTVAKRVSQVRFESMALIREFISKSQPASRIFISGRAHYFDSISEMRRAFQIYDRYRVLSLNEFSEDQIIRFLKKNDKKAVSIPSWLPSRPLLIGYLLARGIFDPRIEQGKAPGGTNNTDDVSPAQSWDYLVDRICARETDRTGSHFDPDVVRQIIERAATIARATESGLGPLSAEDLQTAFREVVGQPPDEHGQTVLLRLPGLGSEHFEDSSRSFIDQTYVDIARGGDVVRLVQRTDPQVNRRLLEATVSLGEMALNLILDKLGKSLSAKSVSDLIREYADKPGARTLCQDFFNLLLMGGFDYVGSGVRLCDLFFGTLQFDSTQRGETVDLSRIELADCLVERLELDWGFVSSRLPLFSNSIIDLVVGVDGRNALPNDRFDAACTFREFQRIAPTTAGLTEIKAPRAVGVLLSILKKLFLQSGNGRQLRALFRGLDGQEREFVEPVLDILRSANAIDLIRRDNRSIVVPNRRQTGRIRQILANPFAKNDQIIEQVGALH
jgi:hypothetical protein